MAMTGLGIGGPDGPADPDGGAESGGDGVTAGLAEPGCEGADEPAATEGEAPAPTEGEAPAPEASAVLTARLPMMSSPLQPANTDTWSDVTGWAEASPGDQTQMSGPWLPSAGRAEKANQRPSGE